MKSSVTMRLLQKSTALPGPSLVSVASASFFFSSSISILSSSKDFLSIRPYQQRILATVNSLIAQSKEEVQRLLEKNAEEREEVVIIALHPDAGTEGILDASTLVSDFAARFSPGERVRVAVGTIRIEGNRKRIELVLVEK